MHSGTVQVVLGIFLACLVWTDLQLEQTGQAKRTSMVAAPPSSSLRRGNRLFFPHCPNCVQTRELQSIKTLSSNQDFLFSITPIRTCKKGWMYKQNYAVVLGLSRCGTKHSCKNVRGWYMKNDVYQYRKMIIHRRS